MSLATAGKARNYVTIQTISDTRETTYGDVTPTPTTFARCWAYVEEQGGRELFRAQQVQPNLTHLVRVRHVAGVTPKMRVLYDETRVLNIESVVQDAKRQWLTLNCVEAV